MKKVLAVFLLIIIIIAGILIIFNSINNIKKEKEYNNNFSCSSSNKNFCTKDSDCVCVETNGCFFGNNKYYQKCATKTSGCFDLCGGWGQTKPHCVNNQCSMEQGLVYKFLKKYTK
jgi:hypothetical protein